MLKPGLYVVPGGGANSIVRVTNEGVILVDTKLPGEANYNGLMEQIRSVTPQPVKVVIVTHHHADHTGNNDRFISAGAQVIGHEQLAKNLDTYQFDPRPAKPSATYNTAEHTVRLGGVEVRVLHLGRAHTGGDSVVYFPDVKVVATSDAVTTGTQGPLADYAGGGSFAEWTPVLDAMLKLDFDTAVPGAGPVLTKADVQAFRTKFSDRDDARVRVGAEGCAEGSVADATEDGRHWLGTARAADRSVLRGAVEKEVSHGAHPFAFSDYFWGAPLTSMLVARLI